MKYAFAFGTNVNRNKMEITVYEKKDRPINNPQDSIVKGMSGNDHSAENTR